MGNADYHVFISTQNCMPEIDKSIGGSVQHISAYSLEQMLNYMEGLDFAGLHCFGVIDPDVAGITPEMCWDD